MSAANYDFLVVGSGIAGLTFALKCAPRGRVLVVTKSEISDTNTTWAQGGVAAAVGEGDSWRLHEEDTLIAGAGLCDPKAVRYLVQNARPCLDWLISIGARFDLESGNGLPQLDLGLEGGHSRHRIVHHADQSGWEIERALTVAVRSAPQIDFLEHTFCEGLAIAGGRCVGAYLLPQGGGRMLVRSRATILATGSCCRVYRFTTNPPIATGDGIGLASAAGARIENMEFIQFHPTTLYHRDARNFLITEAVRGQGGILRTLHGRRFMYDYDARGDLAPRDIVARAIHTETHKEGVPFVHLDMTHLDPALVARQFPTILERLREHGIDPARDPIPVVPAAHYQCGGIATNLDGQSTVGGLYAAGEVACTGVHGANRLASNSLLEALVFGSSAADAAVAEPDAAAAEPDRASLSVPVVSKRSAEGVIRRLRRVMWERVGIVRSNLGLDIASREIEELQHDASKGREFFVAGAEAANMLECSRIIVAAAAERAVNVGLHYNQDLDPAQAAADSPPVE
jgi:L-aspartate oxidase